MQHLLPIRWPVTWLLLALGALFLALGFVFVAFPAAGAAVYGIPSNSPSGTSYVRAVGLRDVALGGYLILQTLFASARAVSILLLVTLVIPAGDLVLVAAHGSGTLALLPHLASALVFAGMAAWVRLSATRNLVEP